MRKSTLRRRLGELEARTSDYDELSNENLTLRLQVQNLEARVRRATGLVDLSLGQHSPLSSVASHLANIRIALVPENLPEGGGRRDR